MGYPYQGTTPNEYQRLALRTEKTPEFIDKSYTTRSPGTEATASELSRVMHGMIGMATEVGELQDMVKKHLIYGKPFDAVNVLEECGDVLWYIALTLDAVGLTMEEAMDKNIVKLQKRFPDKFTMEAANNRDLDAERKALEGK